MSDLFKKFKNSSDSILVKEVEGGKHRAKTAISKIIKTVNESDLEIAKIKRVILQIYSGENEIKIEEIGIINNEIQKLCPNISITLDICEKENFKHFEIQAFFTSLDLDYKKDEPIIYDYLKERFNS